ncbi:MAG: IPT/TIG domain-containing protein [Bryobacteraceae bacterium]
MWSLRFSTLSVSLLAVLLTPPARGQGLTCSVTAVAPLVRAEGLTERLGDIVLNCTGGAPNGTAGGNLTIFLSTSVTNRLTPDNTLDAILTADTGSGPVSAGVPAVLASNSAVSFNGLNITLSPAGSVTLRVSNLRANVAEAGVEATIQAHLAFTAGSFPSTTNSRFTVGVPERGLLSSSLTTLVSSQQGSPLPEEITYSNLIAAGTRFSSARITEGFADALQSRLAMTDSGSRVVIRYTGYPPDARLFVPDFIAGSSAAAPTAAGDFGGTPSGGIYTPGSGALLLSRVPAADSSGAGGAPLPLSGASAVELQSISEVRLLNGAGTAVYEVLEAASAVTESAQFPTFIGLPRTIAARTIAMERTVLAGPVSSVTTASTSAPIPRFSGEPAPSDCGIQADCQGPFLPKLSVTPSSLRFIATSRADLQFEYITVDNAGGGTLVWDAAVDYKSGTNWIQLDPQSAEHGRAARVYVNPIDLTPGNYEATVVIDAGSQAGRAEVPVSLQVMAVPAPPAAPSPSISSIVNAASLASGPLVPGSLATIRGTNLQGTSLSVTFDGIPAGVLFANDEQINVLVPAALISRASAQVVVNRDGTAGAPHTAQLAAVAPGIFTPGILNQDNSVNGADNPALAGSIIQIFATGLLPPEGAVVDARLHDRTTARRLFAGPAPGLPGVQQVNMVVPEDLHTLTTELVLCASAAGQRSCSPPVKISVRR